MTRAFLSLLFLALLNPLVFSEDKPKGEVIHFSKLLPFLPAVPSGWTSEEPTGTTLDSGGYKMSNVERSYEKGETSVHLTILDFNNNTSYIESTTGGWGNMSMETTEGYTKSATIEGYPAFETFQKEGKEGHVMLLVGKRLMVQVQTTGLDSAVLREWVGKVDLKKLAELIK